MEQKIEQNQKNRKLFPDVDWGFALPSLIIVVLLTIPSIIWEAKLTTGLNNFFNSFVAVSDWLFVLFPAFLVIIGFYMAFSKYGKVVMGDPKEKANISFFTYFATLMGICFGSTIMRTGTIQWAPVAAAPPFGLTPGSNEAILMGSAYSMFLWGLQLAAIYAIIAPAVGYFVHVRRKNNIRISEMCRCLLGDKFTDGIGGKLLDIIFIVAMVIGAATFIGLASPMLSAILAKLFHFQVNFFVNLMITIVLVVCFTISAIVGLEKGIQRLSRINIYLAIAFAAILMLLGPGLFIIRFTSDSFGVLVENYVKFSFLTDSMRGDGAPGYVQSYTVFWWAYCFSWALLQAVFAALISRGRTIKEMLMTYYCTIFTVTVPMSGLLGGMAVYSQLKGKVDVYAALQEQGAGGAIADILSVQVWGPALMLLFVFLAMIFLITGMDSTTFTMAAYSSTYDISKKAPSKSARFLWAILMSAGAMSLMTIGGMDPLGVVCGIIGVPVMIIIVLVIAAGFRMMNQDKAWITNVRAKDYDPEKAPIASKLEDNFTI